MVLCDIVMQTSNQGKGFNTNKALLEGAVFPVGENSPLGLYIGLCNFADILHAPKSLLTHDEGEKYIYMASL